MDKIKFHKAKCDLRDLLNVDTEIYFGGKHTDIADVFNREIVKAARELIAATGDDIAEKSTPAGQYVSNIIFIADGSAIVYYNGDTAGKRFDISAKYALYPTD